MWLSLTACKKPDYRLVCTCGNVDLVAGVVGPPNPDNLPEDGKLKSEVMIKDNRRYYLDLKENQRGRFLRVRPRIW